MPAKRASGASHDPQGVDASGLELADEAARKVFADDAHDPDAVWREQGSRERRVGRRSADHVPVLARGHVEIVEGNGPYDEKVLGVTGHDDPLSLRMFCPTKRSRRRWPSALARAPGVMTAEAKADVAELPSGSGRDRASMPMARRA